GTWFSGLQFFGVNYLTVENTSLWHVRGYSGWIANASYVDIRNIVIDAGILPGQPWPMNLSTDGIHFNGPIRYLTIDGAKIGSGDDVIGLNANDGEADDITINNESGPYVGQGPITDVAIDNLELMGPTTGIRLLSSNQRL